MKRKALILTGKFVQDHEFIYPYYRLQEAGFDVDVAIRGKETVQGIIGIKVVPTKDVFKITITPRGDTGGVTWTPEREEIFIQDKNKLLGQIKISLGSYAAEKLKLGMTTVGVDMDFQKALHIAHGMAWRWGMGKSGIVGNFGALADSRSGGLMSEEMKTRLDADVQEILQTCLKEVQDILQKEERLLERLAKELVAKEELNFDEIEAIFQEFGKGRAQ